MKKLKVAPLLLLFFIVTTYSQDFDFNTQLIPESLKKNANSVVRFENVSIEIVSQRQLIITYESAITIYNKLADKFADITIHYDKGRSINNLSTFIYDANGKEIKKIKKNDYKDYSAYDGISLFNDGRLIHYNHTPISYPYTVYNKYQIKSSNTAFIPSWILNGSYYQGVQNAFFEIKYPSEITLIKSEKHFDGYEIKKTEENGLVSYQIKDIEAFKRESYAPSLYEYLPFVKFGINKFNLEGVDGEASNWKEFGKWYYDNLLQGVLELPDGTKQHIKSITSVVDDPIEKAKIVYEFVQNKVRYISVQVGIGGFQPTNATEVDKLGYGDCKGLTNYTAALLKEIGIEAYHTLIYGSEKRNLDKDVASAQGNHMILYLPISNQDIWLECTSQKHPFGQIGSFTDDRDALVIKPSGGEIMHTKIYEPEENLQLTKGNYEISEKGGLSANVSIESLGTQYDSHMFKYDGESPKNLDLLFKKYLSNINNIKFSKIEVLNNKKELKFQEELDFTATNYATNTGSQLLIPLNAFNKNSYVPKRIRDRKMPINISRGFVDVDEVKIELPANMKIEFVPENIQIENKFGSYTLELEKTANSTFMYKRKLQMNGGQFPKEEYDSYRNFWKEIRKNDNAKIVLTK